MALLKSNPKKALTAVDWNAFLWELDLEPDADNKGSTRRKVIAIGNNFKKYRPVTRCLLVTVSRTVLGYTCLVPLRIPRVPRNRTVAVLSLTRTRVLLSILQNVPVVRAK